MSESRKTSSGRRRRLALLIEKCDAERRRLAEQLLAVDYVWHGSVVRRRQTCGKSSCRCHKDADARHGPYAYWSTYIAGKTVSRLLSPAEANLYESWVKNRQHIERTLAALKKVSAKAAPLILESQAMERAAEAAKDNRPDRRRRPN